MISVGCFAQSAACLISTIFPLIHLRGAKKKRKKEQKLCQMRINFHEGEDSAMLCNHLLTARTPPFHFLTLHLHT